MDLATITVAAVGAIAMKNQVVLRNKLAPKTFQFRIT